MKKDDGKDAAAGGENTGEMRPAPETARRLSADAQCEAGGPEQKAGVGGNKHILGRERLPPSIE